MEKTTALIIGILMTGILFAQPEGPQRPGDQYGKRMEMMTIWKLTDYLDLSEQQAEKFFPRMRSHQKKVQVLQKDELELFKPLLEKVSKNEEITKAELKIVLDKLDTLDQKRIQARSQFIKKTGDVLTPTQQAKLVMFKGHMKTQVRGKIEEYRNPRKMRKQRMGRRNRF